VIAAAGAVVSTTVTVRLITVTLPEESRPVKWTTVVPSVKKTG